MWLVQGVCVSPQTWVCLQDCVRRSLSALCNKPANPSYSREGCSPALTHSLPLTLSKQEKRGKKKLCFQLLQPAPPSSVGVEGSEADSSRSLWISLTPPLPTSLLVEVLYAIEHFRVHLILSFGKGKQDTCCVTSHFCVLGPQQGIKGPGSPALRVMKSGWSTQK